MKKKKTHYILMWYLKNSTIDWCEKNYEVHPNIAEFWNTITSIAILISAVLFRVNYPDAFRRQFSRFFKNVFYLLIIVSIGTCLFHSHLLYHYQLLDELPILLIAVEYIKLLNSLPGFDRPYYNKIINSGYYIIAVMPFMFVFGSYQPFIFHTTIKCFETVVSIMLLKLYRSSDYKQELKIPSDIAMCLYGCGGFLWFAEHLLCDTVYELQFHAIWHILSSMATYYLNTIMFIHVKNLTY